MLAVLVALRDALLALALGWVGFTFEQSHAATTVVEPANAAPAACGGGSQVCAPDKPSFNALNCGGD